MIIVPERRGHKQPDVFIRALCRNIAINMCAIHLIKRSTIAYESLLRSYCVEVAQAYNWAFQCEVKLPRREGIERGAFPKIDFVLYYYRQVIAVELKHLRATARTIDINSDIEKLCCLEGLLYEQNLSYKYSAYVVISNSDRYVPQIVSCLENNSTFAEIEDCANNNKHRLLHKENDRFVTTAKCGNVSYACRAIKVV